MKKLWKKLTHWWRMRKIRKAIGNDEDPFTYD